MIELIYHEEKEAADGENSFREPKNLKQIGDPKDYKKIYMEDYVHTFLQQYAAQGNGAMRLGILFGKSERCGQGRYLMIQSAAAVEGVGERGGKYLFTEKIWDEIYRTCEMYFPEQEILGWFLSRPGFPVESTSLVEETHRIYFSGADKVLFMMEPMEGESGFFGFNGSRFLRQTGYYIYYEKNEPMQNYLIGRNEDEKKEKDREKPDVVMANFRKILKEKQEIQRRRKKKAISYGARSAVLLILFVSAVTMMNRSDFSLHFQFPEKTAEVLENELEETLTEEVIVEELPGEVAPEEEFPTAEPEISVEPTEANAEETAEENEEDPVQETAEEPETRTYVVQNGDTLAGISRTYYGNDQMIEEICRINEIMDVDYIQVGETILLP